MSIWRIELTERLLRWAATNYRNWFHTHIHRMVLHFNTWQLDFCPVKAQFAWIKALNYNDLGG